MWHFPMWLQLEVAYEKIHVHCTINVAPMDTFLFFQKSVKLGIFITFYLKRGWNEIICWQLCRLAFYLRTLKGNECIGGVCRWGILKNFYVTCSCTWTVLAPLGRTHCGPWRDLRLLWAYILPSGTSIPRGASRVVFQPEGTRSWDLAAIWWNS